VRLASQSRVSRGTALTNMWLELELIPKPAALISDRSGLSAHLVLTFLNSPSLKRAHAKGESKVSSQV
jgi:hypothetical protein